MASFKSPDGKAGTPCDSGALNPSPIELNGGRHCDERATRQSNPGFCQLVAGLLRFAPNDDRTRSDSALDFVVLLLLVIASIGYFAETVSAARSVPFWMDEVLAVWTARLPTMAAIWNALKEGADFSPPLFHWLLHAIIRSGGNTSLMLRSPSIIAIYVAGAAAFVLVRRRFHLPAAALAMALCLSGGLVPYGWEARPYACVVACFAIALVLWDVPADRTPSRLGAAALCAALALAVGLHFYAVLLVVVMGIMECAWSAKHRRIRISHVLAIALAGVSILIWLPIMTNVSSFNRADVSALDCYARPVPAGLLLSYLELFMGHRPIWLSLFIMLFLVPSAHALISLKSKKTPQENMWRNSDLAIIVGASWAIPAFVFLFAIIVTHAFNARYVIAAAVGTSIYLALLVADLPRSRQLCCLLLLATAALSFTPPLKAGSAPWPTSVFADFPAGLPIVTGNGLRFFELQAAESPVSSRLVYLSAPVESPASDQTNDHAVRRWKRIAPDLPVEDASTFLRSHSRFLLLHDCSAADPLPAFLAHAGLAMKTISQAGCAAVFEVATRKQSNS